MLTRRKLLAAAAAQLALPFALNRSANGWAHGIVPNGTQAVASAGYAVSRVGGGPFKGGMQQITMSQHITGPSTIKQIQIADTDLNGLMFGASGQNPTIQRNLYIPGAPNPQVTLTYGGNSTGILSSSTVLLPSDPVYPSQFGLRVFPANSPIFTLQDLRFTVDPAQNDFNLVGPKNGGAFYALGGFGGSVNTPFSNFVNVIGSSLTEYFGNSAYTRCPLAVLGIPTRPHIAVLAHGDSLIQGYNPANDDTTQQPGHKGWLARGLANVNGNQIPWTNLGVDANSSANAISPTGLSLLTALAPFFTHFIGDFGHNSDLNVANEMARITKIWNALKNAPESKIRHIEHCLLMPDCSSGFSISSLTSTGTTCTAVGSGGRFLSDGMSINISGASPAAYNGTFTISSVVVRGASSSFQYTVRSAPGSSATGTITGNDYWATIGNQTPKSGFEPSGRSFKDQFNAALNAAVGNGLLNATFHHASIEPQDGYWLTNGTAYGYTSSPRQPDGTHPNTNGQALMGAAFNKRAATWT